VTILDITGGTWDSVFVNTDTKETLRIFERGFRLSSPRILRIVFVSGRDEVGSNAIDARDRQRVSDENRTVFVPDLDLWFAFHRVAEKNDGRTGFAPRGDGGRRVDGDTQAHRSGSEKNRRGKSNDANADDDDDDDGDDRLYPAAIAGVVAVGAVAVAGGTVGYYGSTAAPIGLMSGFVHRRGGALLHVAINKQVFGKASGPENLSAGITGFYDVFGLPIQPAVGLGVTATEEGVGGYATSATVSLGVVGNFGPLVVLAGYDVLTPGFRVGTAVNFRYRQR
jgi:hypothetical protein